MRSIGVIPARFASTRFPGKPLAQILGKSLIQHTYERACLCPELEVVLVATDDVRIKEHVEAFGGKVVMTSSDCANGTERIFEVLEKFPEGCDVVVNIQGDEPSLNPEIISKLIHQLTIDQEAVVATPIAEIHNPDEIMNPSVVKCVKDVHGRALYFSRAPIPHLAANSNRDKASYYRHVGLYAYRREFLNIYHALASTPLQLTEELEQLKILEHRYPIAVVECDYKGFDVNDPSDIQKVEKYLCQQNTSL